MNVERNIRHHAGHGCSIVFLIFAAAVVIFFGFHDVAPAQGMYSGLSVLPGDADCDGQITVADLVALVRYIFDSQPLPKFCMDTVTIFSDSTVTIKRLVLPVDSTVYAGNYFATSLLQKFYIYHHGQLLDSAAWLYQVIPLSLNRNIPPAESLGVKRK